MDAPGKRYHQYKESLENWTKLRAGIVGNAELPGSLAFFQFELKFANEQAEQVLSERRAARVELVRKIHAELRGQATLFRDLYAPVQKLVDNKDLAAEGLSLEFAVSISSIPFRSQFFGFNLVITHASVP